MALPLLAPHFVLLNSGANQVSLLSLFVSKYCIASNRPILIAMSFLTHCNNINFFFRYKIALVSLIRCVCVSNYIGMCVARVCLLLRKRADEGVLHRTEALSQAHPSLMLPLNPIFVFRTEQLKKLGNVITT